MHVLDISRLFVKLSQFFFLSLSLLFYLCLNQHGSPIV